MGGLIGLLMIRQHGTAEIEGIINIEGNAPEDSMFSRRVTFHTFVPKSGERRSGAQSRARWRNLPSDCRTGY